MHYHVCILINFKTLNRLNLKKNSSNKNKQIYLFHQIGIKKFQFIQFYMQIKKIL